VVLDADSKKLSQCVECSVYLPAMPPKQKAESRACIPTMTANWCNSVAEMQWVSRITKALEENHFRLYSRRIVPIAQTETKSEHWQKSLLRRDETGKIISPMAFDTERATVIPD